MGKKSQSQLKRLRMRAEARGEVYKDPAPASAESESPGQQLQDTLSAPPAQDATTTRTTNEEDDRGDDAKVVAKRRKAAKQLKKSLDEIAADSSMKAKERRAAKRKAEAIAAEASRMDPDELLAWYQREDENDDSESASLKKKMGKKSNPYVAFIGQLSYQTTADGLFAYLQKSLGDDVVTSETVKIRLLTKKKGDSEVSRGMAFVETSTPELLYSCLSLHHTHLDGRRINVERTAGGRNPLKRKSKIDELRQDQLSHQREVIHGILRQHNMLEGDTSSTTPVVDAGVVQLCERHAASVVQAALERFESTNGPDKDNPSAYLTFLLTKLSQEGILEDATDRPASKKQKQGVARR